jgi:hypothetical protein
MKVEEIVQEVFDVSFEEQRDLAKTFIRFQEYYENPFFRGKIFTFDEFREWYIASSPRGKKTGKFTYYQDWDGFNVPSGVLVPFYKGRFDPLSKEERFLLNRFEDRKENRFYLIGTLGEQNIATLKHEISHGLFYTCANYKREMLEVLEGLDSQEKEKVYRFLRDSAGYHLEVFDDETISYLIDRRCLGRNGVSGTDLSRASSAIKEIFRRYYEIRKVK